MPTMRLALSTAVPLLAVVLMVTTSGSATLAGKGDRGGKGDKETAPTEPPAVIAVVDGDQVKMARTKVAKSVTRIADAVGDQVLSDGTPAPDAEAWSDIRSVHLAPIKVPGKLVARIFEDFPRGAQGTFYGADADWSRGDHAVFVAIELADRLPSDPVVQQVEVGLDGDAAGPLQVGAATDTRAGLERFSLSGTFRDGSESSGTTDVSGRLPGEPIDYYDAESGVFGFHDDRAATYYLIMPLPGDAQSVSVALRTVTAQGEIVDRLELPGGGHLVSLEDPAGAWDPELGAPLACRSLETYSSAAGLPGLEDPGTTRIRYAAGADPALDQAEADALLAALDGIGDTLPVTLQPAGGDKAATEGSPAEPLTVDATLERAPGLHAFTLTMDVPAGRWTFTPPDDAALSTPAGEALVDVRSLIGRGGLGTGEGLDGFVAGDPACARFNLGADVCAFVPADDIAGLVGLDGSEIEQQSRVRSDGAHWCVGMAPATDEVQYIARVGTGYLTSEAFAREVAASPCAATPRDLGAEAVMLDCGADGYERHLVRVLPDAIAERDPEGGLLVSVDMLVDGAKPAGERYDPGAAEAFFSELVEKLASSAEPAG